MKCQKCKKEMVRVAVVEIKNKIIQEDFYCKKCKKIIIYYCRRETLKSSSGRLDLTNEKKCGILCLVG